jgi:hypothetical protein
VLDRVTMVVAQALHHLLEVERVASINSSLVDLSNRRDKLTVTTFPILLALCHNHGLQRCSLAR